MAKAAICITNCHTSELGKARVSYDVSVDDGATQFSSSAVVDFTVSVTQFALTIKDRVATQVANLGGPALLTTDMLIFGGPL